MKAARYYGKEDVRVDDIDEPTTRAGTVKIKPAWNGICGSDLHLFREGPIPPAPTTQDPHPVSGETLPVVLGHEFSGTVEEVGADVGDLPLDQAALIEPLAVAVHGVRLSGTREGDVAVVGGAGPIGLLTAAVLKASGVRVIVSEVAAARKEKANGTGVADIVVDPTSDDLADVVKKQTGGAGADVAFDCAGVPVVFDQLLDALRPGGRLEVIALHGNPIELDVTGKLVMPEHSVGCAIGYAEDHPQAIKLVQSGKVDLAPFITSRIRVEDIAEKGFQRLIDNNDTEVKILVQL